MSVSSESLDLPVLLTPQKKGFGIYYHGNGQHDAGKVLTGLTTDVEDLKRVTEALLGRVNTSDMENLDEDDLKDRIKELEGEIGEICRTYLGFCNKFLLQTQPKRQVKKGRSSRNMSAEKASKAYRKSTPDAVSKWTLKPRETRTEYVDLNPIGSESSLDYSSSALSNQAKKLEQLLDVSFDDNPFGAGRRGRGLSIARKKETDSESPFSLKHREHIESTLPPVINPKTISDGFTFEVETPLELFNKKTFNLSLQPSLYTEQFSHSDHSVWLGSYPKNDDYLIVVVDNENNNNNYYRSLVFSKKGITDSQLLCIKKNSKTLQKNLEHHYLPATFEKLKSPDLIRDLIMVEEKHKLAVKKMEIGVIYAKSNQTNPLEMFSNEPSPTFNQFMKILGRDVWRGFPVVWHNATEMDEEQHRGVIGNLQCVLFFKEKDGVQFDASLVGKLGPIPQFFIVIEPCLSGYRVGFFNRDLLDPFGPQLPVNYIFEETELLDFLLTKVHNGYMASMRCGKLSRLHEEPFACTLKEIAEKYSQAHKPFLLKMSKH